MKNIQQKGNKWLRKTVIISAWLILWQIVSMLVDNSILLVGPVETLFVLLGKIMEIDFWKTILFSLGRILAGFLAGWVLGLILAAAGASNEWVEDVLRPVMTLMKTVPVASFVVLFLIWFRSGVLAIGISLCVVLPNVYLNTLEGIKCTDVKLLEMAKVFDLHPVDRFMYIYRPALKPFWDSCMKLSVGMSWKSGVAAEVIGTPDFSIGEQLYMSKIHFDTAGVLAWTAVIIVISILCEKYFLKIWKRFMDWQPACKGIANRRSKNRNLQLAANSDKLEAMDLKKPADRTGKGEILVSLQHISKSYGDNHLFSNLNAEYIKCQSYYFRTPSGSGKTTLFRMISGLEKPDQGKVWLAGEIAYAFQEDRLCETFSAVKNVELVTGDREKAIAYLRPLLGEADIVKPCGALSGGMKRRVAVARAFAAERATVLLDEPFSGLDEEKRRKMQRYIADHGSDKAVLIATHL